MVAYLNGVAFIVFVGAAIWGVKKLLVSLMLIVASKRRLSPSFSTDRQNRIIDL